MPVERTPKVLSAPKRKSGPNKQHGSGSGGRQARRGGAGNGGGGGNSKRGGAQRLEEYEQPMYSEAESACFNSSADWHDVEVKLARPGIKHITFGPDFPVADEHLSLIGYRPQVANILEMLSLGDEDTGNGSWLTDDAVLRVVSATPNLRVLWLSSCLNLTDATLINVLMHCPRLESLRISAHDKGRGKITHKGLKSLRDRSEIGSALKELVLLSQPVSGTQGEKEGKLLSKSKKGLAVTIGDCPGRYDDDGAPDSVLFGGKRHFFGMPVDDW